MIGVLKKDGDFWYVNFSELDEKSFLNIVDGYPVPTNKKLLVHSNEYSKPWVKENLKVGYNLFISEDGIAYAVKLVKKPVKEVVSKKDPIKFELNLHEHFTFNKIRENIKKEHGKYGVFTFSFTHTGIGVKVEITNSLTKDKKDITDYNAW
jgi:hypothetical protein